MSLKDNYYALREKRRAELERQAQASKEEIFDKESAAVDGPERSVSLPSTESLNTEAEDSGIRFLSLSVLDKYRNDPFREYTDRRLEQLVDSIRDRGILSPIVVRPKVGGRYEILSGRHRANAAMAIGMEVVPCIVKEADDDEAALVVTEANLNQRENLLPSEKAFAYKMRFEALKNQGKNHDILRDIPDAEQEDLHLCPQDTNANTRRTIHRYIRLAELEHGLIELVDNGRMPIAAAEQLSYLTRGEQLSVNQYFYVEKRATLDVSTARLLRERAREEPLRYAVIQALFEKKKKPQKSSTLSLKMTNLRKHIPDELTKKAEIEQYIMQALVYYERQHHQKGETAAGGQEQGRTAPG